MKRKLAVEDALGTTSKSTTSPNSLRLQRKAMVPPIIPEPTKASLFLLFFSNTAIFDVSSFERNLANTSC